MDQNMEFIHLTIMEDIQNPNLAINFDHLDPKVVCYPSHME